MTVAQPVTAQRILLSEWTKLRSLRSTVISLLAAVALIIGLAILLPLIVVAHWPPPNAQDVHSFDALGVSLVGGFLAQLAVGVLGVLVITGEYSTGMIRATLTAVPKRLPVLWAKAAVYVGVCLALLVPANLIAFFIAQSILSSKDIDASLGDPGVARVVIGSAIYIAGVGLLGLTLGALLRNTAGAISALFGVVFVLPTIVHFLPASWNDAIAKYLPSNAGTAVTNLHPSPESLGPWTGLALFLLYSVAGLALASYALLRRDA